MRSARQLAEAEAWAREVGVVFVWEDDWSIGDHVSEYDTYDEEPDTCEQCVAWLGETPIASLSCIDGADQHYRRVIEAELAEEGRWLASRWYVDAYTEGIRRLTTDA